MWQRLADFVRTEIRGSASEIIVHARQADTCIDSH
jgi:hypothetical protein